MASASLVAALMLSAPEAADRVKDMVSPEATSNRSKAEVQALVLDGEIRDRFIGKYTDSAQSYLIRSNGGRPPSRDYQRDMAKKATDWLNRLGGNRWQVSYSNLRGEISESPIAPLPQYISISQDGLHVTIGLDDQLTADMTASEVQKLINFIANDGFPIPELSSKDWTVEASTPSSHTNQGFQVLGFSNGKLTLALQPDFFAVYGQDTRVMPKADTPMPKLAYFQNRRSFGGDITLKIAIDELNPEQGTSGHSAWRKIGHEAWDRASAPTIFELFSVYAHKHMAAEVGQPAIIFRARKASVTPVKYRNAQMVSATISIFGLLDDSIAAQRWSGLARYEDGTWYLEKLFLSQKCSRSDNVDRWTGAPCP